MAKDNDIYVQTFITKMRMPDGSKRTGKFMGLAVFTPEEFKKMKQEYSSLQECFVDDEQCILMGEPVPLEKAITGEDRNDIVDMVREELRREHHEQLTEKKTKDPNG